jgi:hypothetical protein
MHMMQRPPLSPSEITEAAIIFNEINLQRELYLPRDKVLLGAARMTLPILSMAITFHSIMEHNRQCIQRYHSRIDITDALNDRTSYFPTQSTEFFLHRSDMSTYVEEHDLCLDFGNAEGSLGEEVSLYSHRFDEYIEFINDIKLGYTSLCEKTSSMKFVTEEEKEWALQYVQCCRDMELIIQQLVDGFQLNFMDPCKLLNSAFGVSLFNERGSILVRRKLDRLQEHLDYELSIALPPHR